MSFATLILGESGSGKTCSLRNIKPEDAILIQPVRKPLPFPSKGWKLAGTQVVEQADKRGNMTTVTKLSSSGNVLCSQDIDFIIRMMNKTCKKIIIIDDWQYFLSFKFMARCSEKNYEKFTEIGNIGFKLAKAASELSEDKRVYVMAHTHTDDYGITRIKTLGKMLDDKICVEGMFTTVLRTYYDDGKYMFRTQTNGNDTVKSPMGMFEEKLIDNDLAQIDAIICDYYGIEETNQKEETK